MAVPNAFSIVAVAGLQPKFAPLATEPLAVMTGSSVSTFQVIVRDVLATLPHASVEVNVRVWLRAQPLLLWRVLVLPAQALSPARQGGVRMAAGQQQTCSS